MRQVKRYKPVVIKWEDIETQAGWIEANKDVNLPVFETIGFLTYKDKNKVVICDTKSGVGNVTVFPAGCILDIKHLEK